MKMSLAFDAKKVLAIVMKYNYYPLVYTSLIFTHNDSATICIHNSHMYVHAYTLGVTFFKDDSRLLSATSSVFLSFSC